ncbi:MAG: glucose-1-phosphate cytidylyltransferase [Planctomycetota bacterium]
MKVVLFCGGFGMRIREYSESIPKPMVPIGSRPILWHVMKYYAHFGHKDFILCLGWKANTIKQYFLNYDECISNDFVLTSGGSDLNLLSSDIDDWNITFVDTGTAACIGERLKAVQPFLGDDETFLANYTDGLSDVHLPNLIQLHQHQNAVATFVSVRPSNAFHCVSSDSQGHVKSIETFADSDTWINGGFFVLSREIFRYMNPGDELVTDALPRLIPDNRLCTYRHAGFWSCMDTYKEKQTLDEMHDSGHSKWEVWNQVQQIPTNTLSLRNGHSVIDGGKLAIE